MVATVRQISSSSNSGKYFYFTEKNLESASSWHDSKGIAFLDLPSLTQENFEGVLDGKLPEKVWIDGKESVVERVLGKKTAAGLEHNPGRELILSAPKSVSIMALVAGDERVLEAHEKAVSATLDYYERNMVFAKIKKDGIFSFERTDNIIAAKFTHICSRSNKDKDDIKESDYEEQKNPDPQLHTHCLIANATRCKDGVWRSIIFDKIYDNKMHLGELYRMELGYNLEHIGCKLDFQKDKANRWTFEIEGVPKEDIKEFSKRREKILEVADELNRHDSESLALIAKATREEKVNCSREDLQKGWEQRCVDLVHLKEIKDSLEVFACKEKNIKSAAILTIKHLSEREAVFSKEAIIEDLFQRNAGDFSISKIEKALAEFASEGQLLTPYEGEKSNFTTPANLKAEREVIGLMQGSFRSVKPIMTKKEIDENLREKDLTIGQKDAVYLALGTSDRIIGVQGSAGAGKTTVLKTIKECSAEKSYELIGLTPTRASANNMSSEAGIDAMTVHLFLAKYAGVLAGRGTAKGRDTMKAAFSNKIVVLDEAGLASSWQIRDLLTLSKELKFRVMMLGDVKQLGAVEAGKPFYYLQNHGLNTVSMNTIQRQQNSELLKSVLLAERAVDSNKLESRKLISQSLEVLGAENIHDLSEKSSNKSGIYTNEDFACALYEKWQALHKDKKNPLVVVPSNPLRKLVNEKIRTHYVKGRDIEHEVLKNKGLTNTAFLDIRSYEIGDVLVFNKDNAKYGIESGDYLTVSAVNLKDGGSLILKNRQKEIEFSSESLAVLKKGSVEVFKPDILNLGEGERIKWTRNSKSHNFVINGGSATVKQLKSSSVIIETNDKKLQKIPLSDPILRHIDHDYSQAVYGAQSKTVDYVIGACRAREKYIDLSTQRALYVILSRARHGAFLVTDNYKRLIQSLSIKTGDKTSAIAHQKPSETVNLVALQQSGREVSFSKGEVVIEPKFAKIDYQKTYQDFSNSPDLIRHAACDAFGEINEKLSKYGNLRFGNKGHITVDLKSGQWYDFKSGEGGNLYKMFKDSSAFSYSSYSSRFNEEHKQALSRNSETEDLQKKISAVNTIYKNSIGVLDSGALLAQKYLKERRKIDFSKVDLSDDIRFIEKSWSSETKSYHPALVSFARNAGGEVQASQMIFLDPKTADKNQSVEVVKRTFGVLKNSFVEVTKNISSDVILIAEGLETALSLAESAPEARVICSLGISNIRNISFDKDINANEKTVIICADNDGIASSTNLVIERAANTIKEQGVKRVLSQ